MYPNIKTVTSAHEYLLTKLIPHVCATRFIGPPGPLPGSTLTIPVEGRQKNEIILKEIYKVILFLLFLILFYGKNVILILFFNLISQPKILLRKNL